MTNHKYTTIRAEFTFPGSLKNEPIVWYLGKHFDIIVKILEASFSTDTGWAILVLDGSEKEINRAFDYLTSQGVNIKNKQKLA
jgi:ABC-type methionine transport system ATPase subunit